MAATLYRRVLRALVAAVLVAAPGVTRAGEWDGRLLRDSAHTANWLPAAVAGALSGHAEDERAVGAGYEWGDALPRDYAAALAWYRRAAQHGSVAGLVDMGILVAGGMGGAADPAAAVATFRLAAALGSAAAETRLGMAYEWGLGVEADPREARSHYATAVSRGDPVAAVYLMLVYDRAPPDLP